MDLFTSKKKKEKGKGKGKKDHPRGVEYPILFFFYCSCLWASLHLYYRNHFWYSPFIVSVSSSHSETSIFLSLTLDFGLICFFLFSFPKQGALLCHPLVQEPSMASAQHPKVHTTGSAGCKSNGGAEMVQEYTLEIKVWGAGS